MEKHRFEDISQRFASIRRKNSVNSLNNDSEREEAFKKMKASSLVTLVALVIIYAACRIVFGV